MAAMDIAPKSILVIVPRPPWPARRSGFSVRYFPLLRFLGHRHHVDLVTLGESAAPGSDSPLPPDSLITHVDVAGRKAALWQRVVTVLRGLLPGSAPHALRSVWTGQVVRGVLEASRQRNYDLLLWAGPEYLEAAYLVARKSPAARCVIDFVDSPSLIASRARGKQAGRFEMSAIRGWENRLRSCYDLAVYISEADALASQPAGLEGRTAVLPNGVYLDDLGGGSSAQQIPAGLPPRYVLFFGHMSFGPNVDAAQWLAQEIMPALREHHHGLALVIAGHQPSPAVRALADADTFVTGSVDSMWPYIDHAAVCIFPLRRAAGLQNKILEALAAGKAVVTTRHCAAGVGSEPLLHLLTADSTQEFVEASLKVLDDPAFAVRLGTAGSQLVRTKFDWNVLAGSFEGAILAGGRGSGGRWRSECAASVK